ncbi:MAG: hypothetical protein RL499_1677 [Actinomycetota bacterium]|jgi:hypothetical protein
MATNAELQIALKEAGRLVRAGRFLVIGSQSLLGTFSHDELPAEATASLEFDVAVFGDIDSQAADRIDGALGEWSDFHDAQGFYVQGVDVDTAIVPAGWQDRVTRVPVLEAPDVEAVCLDPHDTCAAKLARNEERDRRFVRALVDARLIDPLTLAERITMIADERLEAARKRVVLAFVRSLAPR